MSNYRASKFAPDLSLFRPSVETASALAAARRTGIPLLSRVWSRRLSTACKELQKSYEIPHPNDNLPSMELADGRKDVVDPEVRAYVSSLVTAVSCSNCPLRPD